MKSNSQVGVVFALSISIGIAIGVATGDLGLWLPVGIANGAGVTLGLLARDFAEKSLKQNSADDHRPDDLQDE